MDLIECWPDWTGRTCVIVASGPSAPESPIDLARGKCRVIAINNSWQLAPWADILYACDWAWWNQNKGRNDFAGLRVSIDKRSCDKWDIKYVQCNKGTDSMEFAVRGKVGWGGNSGFHALNLAVQFGCSRVLLVGYDMHVNNGAHWHGNHPSIMNNPRRGNVERWRRAVDGAAAKIAERGVEVVNCSANSALQNYKKMPLDEALSCT